MNNPLKSALRLIFGIYAWSMLALSALLTLLMLLIIPGIQRRRHFAHWAARFVLNLVGIRLQLRSGSTLPDRPCIVVANHCSYVDGLVMKAALPARFSFVIKKEMVRMPLAGLLLKRIGSLFVDRANRHAGGMDARRILREAMQGQSLVFFPEGTFDERIGLNKFHLGAFATAQRAQLPVVPVALQGTRKVLRPGSPWPRPGLVQIEVLGVLEGDVNPADRTQSEQLRDQARAHILMALGEPDLVNETELPARE